MLIKLRLEEIRQIASYTARELVPMRVQKRRARAHFEKTRRGRNLADVIDHEFMSTLDLYGIRPVRKRDLWHALVRGREN
jgi:hypothetical protein